MTEMQQQTQCHTQTVPNNQIATKKLMAVQDTSVNQKMIAIVRHDHDDSRNEANNDNATMVGARACVRVCVRTPPDTSKTTVYSDIWTPQR